LKVKRQKTEVGRQKRNSGKMEKLQVSTVQLAMLTAFPMLSSPWRCTPILHCPISYAELRFPSLEGLGVGVN